MTQYPKTTCRAEDCTTRARHSSHGLCTYHWRITISGYKSPINYNGAHRRVYRAKGTASGHACICCGQQAQSWAYDHLDADELTGEDGPYSTNPDHYHPLCWPCHNRMDKSLTRGDAPSDAPPSPEGKAQSPLHTPGGYR